MTRVIIVHGATTVAQALRKANPADIAFADMVIGLNEDGSEAVIFKDRYGKIGVPVQVVA